MTTTTQILPGDESDNHTFYHRKMSDNPLLLEAIRDYPGIDWDDSPLPGEFEIQTPAERTQQWRRINPGKAAAQRNRY